MTRRAATAFLAWLAFVAVAVAVIAQTRFTADLSAFLPRTPTAEQQVLVDQLRDGMVSRLLLVGIEGGDAASRAAASRELARRLRDDPAFGAIANGEPVHHDRDRALLFENRYLLSPAVSPQRFTVEGLREAIGESIELLASPLGLLTKSLLPRDPTGETLQLLERLDGEVGPATAEGVWASGDGRRALLLAQTRAAGSNLDGQQQAIAAIRAAFAEAAGAHRGELRLRLSGPGVFAVASRDTIRGEVERLALVSLALIVALLLFIYRSATALALGLLPMVSGALAGIVAVSLGFGVVHGITLGFGTTLIGEAVDYAIYLFVQARTAGDRSSADAADAFWPTIRLGVLTSISGFAALLLSGFPGLAQLGLYSVAGLLAAVATTRYVLPHLLPTGFAIRDVSPLGRRLQAAIQRARPLRWALALLVLAAAVVLVAERDRVWNRELAALSPVPAAEQALDLALRADLGAPDVRYLVVVRAADAESALRSAEAAGERLQALVDDGALGGFDSPALYLPSQGSQLARRAVLPESGALVRRLAAATDGLPLPPERLAPFVADIAAARARAPLTRADLDASTFALAVDALLFEQRGGWTALLPLRAPTDGERALDADRVAATLADTGALFIDMKRESDRLYSGYLGEALLLALVGVAGVVALLALALRSAARVARVLAPLAAAVVVVVAGLVAAGVALTILHLVGLLLIVAVGSNYALFFDRDDRAPGPSPRVLASMLFANLTTVAGFGVLAFSPVPVLQALGATVGPGAILALLFSAILARP